MRISETTFPFLENDCVQTFGAEKGSAIFQQTEALYQKLLSGADYKNSDAVKEHLQRKLFPKKYASEHIRYKCKRHRYLRLELRQSDN